MSAPAERPSCVSLLPGILPWSLLFPLSLLLILLRLFLGSFCIRCLFFLILTLQFTLPFLSFQFAVLPFPALLQWRAELLRLRPLELVVLSFRHTVSDSSAHLPSISHFDCESASSVQRTRACVRAISLLIKRPKSSDASDRERCKLIMIMRRDGAHVPLQFRKLLVLWKSQGGIAPWP